MAEVSPVEHMPPPPNLIMLIAGMQESLALALRCAMEAERDRDYHRMVHCMDRVKQLADAAQPLARDIRDTGDALRSISKDQDFLAKLRGINPELADRLPLPSAP